MTLVCSGMLGIDSGCDLLSFWHGGQVASEANFGLWPLLMSLLEYFRICTQSFRKYAISNQFWPLGGAPASYHYFGFSECVRFSMITIPLLYWLLKYFFDEIKLQNQNLHIDFYVWSINEYENIYFMFSWMLPWHQSRVSGCNEFILTDIKYQIKL